MRSKILVLAGCLAAAGLAHAQSAFTPQELDKLSRDNAATSPRPTPPPPLAAETDAIVPLAGYSCMGIKPWQPVYAAPDAKSPQIGKTQTQIAVSGKQVQGFDEVLFYNGRHGFVPAVQIHPFKSDVRPGGTCSIAGVRPNGAPVFEYQ
jgi:hypothetical protein